MSKVPEILHDQIDTTGGQFYRKQCNMYDLPCKAMATSCATSNLSEDTDREEADDDASADQQ